MRKRLLRTALCCVLMTTAAGTIKAESPDTITPATTIYLDINDSPETIIEKAVNVVPTKNQLAALEDGFIAFIHFGPNTFTKREWGTGFEDPAVFDLKTLDTDQWCKAMKDAGMKKVILTAKHHDGFVLWQSRYTDHGIMSSPFMNGKGDIMKSLSESCKKYGLKLGVYLSPADLYHIEQPDGLYGNLSKATKRKIPRETEGRPFASDIEFEFVVDDYNEYFLNQLYELLTEYGPIHEVWFDGAHPKHKGGQKYNYTAWKELIHTLAPEAVIFGREDLRWCGNEGGGTRDVEWNVVPYIQNPDTATQFADMTDLDLGSREKLTPGSYLHYQPAETDTSIREGWFYRDDSKQKVRSADDVFDIYERSVGGNAIFLLNIPPNREGKFSAADVATLEETGKRIRETYGTNLLEGAKGPAELFDGNNETVYKMADGSFEIALGKPIAINRIVIQEDVANHGERIERHAIDAMVNGEWREVASAANVGYKRILRFPEVTTDRLRVRVTESRKTPYIANVSAHHYKSRPPQLSVSRDENGLTSIAPKKEEFGWNSRGESASGNLNQGYKIYYTLDGSDPDESSTLYTEAVTLPAGRLKAIAILNGEKGPVADEQLPLAKTGWKTEQKAGATVIDMGRKQKVTGLAFIPLRDETKADGTVKGKLKWSKDGRKWHDLDQFEFGNLVNDPTRRYHFLKKPVEARYISVEANSSKGNIALAPEEIDLL